MNITERRAAAPSRRARWCPLCILLLPATLAAHGDHAPLDPDMQVENRIEAAESAFGRMGARREAGRIVELSVDARQRLSPEPPALSQGETVRLLARNNGDAVCQFVIGRVEDVHAQSALIRQHPGGVFDSPSSQRLRPGSTTEIIWEFTRAGEFAAACLSATGPRPEEHLIIRVTPRPAGDAPGGTP
ncbi:MAG: hypothetical protein ACOY33_02280 [Pseudomonadota bacterium]